MASLNKKPQAKAIDWEKFSVSGRNMGIVLRSILDEDIPVSFYARGISMTPFIQDGDKITIKPLSQIRPLLGRVVPIINPNDEKLIVHRIIAKKSDLFLIKGDFSSKNNDGWVEESQILGCVSCVKREERKITFGLGLERYAIAFLSKLGWLTKIFHYLERGS